MTLALQEILQALTKMEIELLLNRNRSTMVSILERRRGYARLSLHHMFSNAPNHVLIALADLIKNKKNPDASKILRHFFDEIPFTADDRNKLNPGKLVTLGKHFNLKEIYEKINQDYFGSELDLLISWFKAKQSRYKSQFSFGLYYESEKLIKINERLDDPIVPQFFIEFVIYHEMLHDVYKPTYNSSGYRSIHTKEFKEKEKQFPHYEQAKAWEKSFKRIIFK